MSEYLIQSETLDAIADAINAKTGGSSAMTPAEMATEIAAIPSGGGSYDGLELVSVDSSTQRPSAWKWHGTAIPNLALYYMAYNGSVATIDISDVEDVGNSAIANSLLRPINVQNVKTCGDFAFIIITNSGETDLSTTSITFPELTGKKSSGSIAASVFRSQSSYYYQKIFLPKFQYIGDYTFYQRRVPNSEVVLGSIGYPVLTCSRQPFGNSSGVGTVTVYTTGALLDTIKTNMQNSASASYTFVYKAAEATEYGGVSYAAGDTMLTVGGA